MNNESKNDDLVRRIEDACRYIEDRLDEDLPLGEVADAVHCSKFHFHRLFRGVTGETVRGYARRLRLERAAHRLVHTDEDILSIALDVGYASHEAFTRAFTSCFGITPSKFRVARQDALPPVGTAEHEPIAVRIERREPCTVACVRHVGPYSDVGGAWKALMKWGWTKMLFGSPDVFGLCHDDPDVTDAQRVRYDACMVVAAGTRVRGRVGLETRGGGAYAVATHAGPYATLGETYARVLGAIATGPLSGRNWVPDDPPSLENYLNDPRKTRPCDLRTEVWMPVR